ncbi:MAG: rhomboid family intramembrane serine protease [Victivallaceae bacterium]|nr:rhomboid family intramembrane serine protease [Victivallaceae bacterium]
MDCPICGHKLTEEFSERKLDFHCPHCDGRLISFARLRGLCGDRRFIELLWQTAQYGYSTPGIICPTCGKAMRRVILPVAGRGLELDICCACQMIWFDPGELERLPPPSPNAKPDRTSFEQEMPALHRPKLVTSCNNFDSDYDDSPDSAWQYIPALLGLPVELDAPRRRHMPFITWIVAIVCLVVFIFTFRNLQDVVDDWGFIPAQWSRHGGLTIITSMFLHGGILHLIGNLYFLLLFGDNVEDEFGRLKYIVLMASSGVCALLLHSIFDPTSTVPCVGASGFIAGVIASYAICFPEVRLSFMIATRSLVLAVASRRMWWSIPAWFAFALWLLFQAVMAGLAKSDTGGVAYMAHLGGIVPGIVFAIFHRCFQRERYRAWTRY